MVGAGAVPVPFLRRDVDDVPGADLHELPATGLHKVSSWTRLGCRMLVLVT